jgi:hypothetical protein
MKDSTRRLLIANIADTCSRMLENAADLDAAFARDCPQLESARALCCEVQEHALKAAAVSIDQVRCHAAMASTSTGGAIRQCGAIVTDGRCLNGHQQGPR